MSNTRPHAYQLRVALRGMRPLIWRRLEAPSALTLEELHAAIQTAFGWTNSHLFEFRIDGVIYGLTDEETEAWELAKDSVLFTTKLGAVLHRNASVTYVYDMGDYWVHDIEVEREIPAREAKSHVVCTGGEHEGPPEDCGGPAGFGSDRVPRHRASHGKATGSLVTEGLELEEMNQTLRELDATLPAFVRGKEGSRWPALQYP